MIIERIGMLKGKRCLLLEQRQNLLSRYDATVSQIDLAERAKPYFSALKDSTDQDVVKLYSELLTSIVHDVMQDYDQEVILTTGVVRNKTTLDIKTIKSGAIESIDDGRGGSISNLISAGLRFIALYKSTNRRFIMLDEPECWLAPHLIPRFVTVIERMSDLIGIQTVLISHHASDVISSPNSEIISIAFDTSNTLTAIKNDKPTLVTGSTENGEVAFVMPVEQEYQSLAAGGGIGIKKLHLVNVQSHTNTVVELGRGLTVINGDNDIGKSVIARSFAAMMTNDYKDALINHDSDSAFLQVDTEQGSVKWSFKRKAKHSLYQFIVNGNVMREEDCKRGEIPSFLNEILCMPLVNNINIHIADQRDPLFILHPTHSPADRAEMLNLGDAFKQLQIMMQLHDEHLRENRKALKSTKEQIDELSNQLFYMTSLDDVDVLGSELAQASVTDVVGLNVLLEKLSDSNLLAQHESALSLMSSITFDIQPDATYDELLTLMQSETVLHEQELDKLSRLLVNIDAISIHETHSDIADSIAAEGQGDTSITIGKVINCLGNISQINTRALPEFNVEVLNRAIESHYQHEQEIAALEAELEKLMTLQSQRKVCPSCGQSIGESHDEHFTDSDYEFPASVIQRADPSAKSFDTYF